MIRSTQKIARSKIAVKKCCQLRFAQRTDLGRIHIAVLEQHEGGNTADTVAWRGLLVLVDVEFAYLQAALILLGNFLENRCNHLAWTTPFRPVIDQHGPFSLQYVGFEGIVRNVVNQFAHVFILIG